MGIVIVIGIIIFVTIIAIMPIVYNNMDSKNLIWNEMDNLLSEKNFIKNLVRKLDCTKEEEKIYSENIKNNQPLPEGIYYESAAAGNQFNGRFYRISKPQISEEDLKLYFSLKQLSGINTIKKCILFFTILTIISLMISAITFIIMFDSINLI